MTTQRPRHAHRARGNLYIFEGPDGTGKSTVVKGLAEVLARTRPVSVLSLPGQETGTLGSHVYALHHDPARFGIMKLHGDVRQILHLAAHCEAVANLIVPRLEANETVLLDRYWWSMWVYGSLDRVRPSVLKALVMCERAIWSSAAPSAVFVLKRKRSLKTEQSPRDWTRLNGLYARIAKTEQARCRHPIWTISNDKALEKVVTDIAFTIEKRS